jgi:hypothetical protein
MKRLTAAERTVPLLSADMLAEQRDRNAPHVESGPPVYLVGLGATHLTFSRNRRGHTLCGKLLPSRPEPGSSAIRQDCRIEAIRLRARIRWTAIRRKHLRAQGLLGMFNPDEFAATPRASASGPTKRAASAPQPSKEHMDTQEALSVVRAAAEDPGHPKHREARRFVAAFDGVEDHKPRIGRVRSPVELPAGADRKPAPESKRGTNEDEPSPEACAFAFANMTAEERTNYEFLAPERQQPFVRALALKHVRAQREKQLAASKVFERLSPEDRKVLARSDPRLTDLQPTRGEQHGAEFSVGYTDPEIARLRLAELERERG